MRESEKVSSCTCFDVMRNESISLLEYVKRCQQPLSNATDFLGRFLSFYWVCILVLVLQVNFPDDSNLNLTENYEKFTTALLE